MSSIVLLPSASNFLLSCTFSFVTPFSVQQPAFSWLFTFFILSDTRPVRPPFAHTFCVIPLTPYLRYYFVIGTHYSSLQRLLWEDAMCLHPIVCKSAVSGRPDTFFFNNEVRLHVHTDSTT
jgi:hypothetical protein